MRLRKLRLCRGNCSFVCHESRIGALQRDELFVGATFDYPPTLQHNDLVAIAYRAKSMRDDDAGTAPPPEVVIDGLLGDWIERGRGPVLHQNKGMAATRRA